MIKRFNIDDFDLYEKLTKFLKTTDLSYDTLHNEYNNNPYRNYYVYMENDNVIGFISYDDIIDRFEIINIFVDKDFRNEKIGSRLLEMVINLGVDNQIKNITLEVNENNNIAVKLYEKYGFIIKATRQKYYGNDNAYLMEKEMIK